MNENALIPYLENIEEYRENMDINIHESKELIEIIINKHKRFIEEYAKEFSMLDSEIATLSARAKNEKEKRDEVNEKVAVLKEKRYHLYYESQQLRKKMFKLMDLDKEIRSASKELINLKKEIEEKDWKLQTTVMNSEKEKQLVGEIKELYLAIDEINKKVDREKDLNKKIQELSKQIQIKLTEADESHQEMISQASYSARYHNSFIEMNEKLRELKNRHTWLKNRIHGHKEALQYWKNRLNGV